MGFTILCALTLSSKSFGVPFFSPVAPTTKSNRDIIMRDNIYNQANRPDYLNAENEKRVGDSPRGWLKRVSPEVEAMNKEGKFGYHEAISLMVITIVMKVFLQAQP